MRQECLLVIAEILPTEPTPKIKVIPGAYIMEIYTNTTRPTPGQYFAHAWRQHYCC